MQDYKLMINPRGQNLKAKGLRKNGYVPGVMYGANTASMPVMFDRKSFNQMLRRIGESVMFEVALENNLTPVRIKEIQRDPVSREVIHVDLQTVNKDQKVQASVPLKFEGISRIESKGIVIQHQKKNITVEGAAKDIPSYIKVPLGDLKPGQSLHIYDLEVSEELNVVDNINDVILLAVKGGVREDTPLDMLQEEVGSDKENI